MLIASILMICISGLPSFLPAHTLYIQKYGSQIEAFAADFSRAHKTWTENATSINRLNQVFYDSLNHFYASHPNAFDNLSLRLENVLDSVNGKRVASFECWDHYVDNKKLHAHLYAAVPDSLKKLFTGNEYQVLGTILNYDINQGTGYNATDNSCDVGIVFIQPVKIIHLKGHNRPAGLGD